MFANQCGQSVGDRKIALSEFSVMTKSRRESGVNRSKTLEPVAQPNLYGGRVCPICAS